MAKFDSKRYDRYLYQEVRVTTKDGRIIDGKVISFDWMTYQEPTIDIDTSTIIEAVSESDIKDIEITKKHPNPFFSEDN